MAGRSVLLPELPWELYGYGGVSWIYLEQASTLDGAELAPPNTPVSLSQWAKYSAAGFEAGFGARYRVFGGLSLNTEFGGIAAIGERTTNFTLQSLETMTIPGGLIFDRIPTITSCVTGLDVKLKAVYRHCCACFSWEIGVGYEHQQYFDVLRVKRLYFGSNNNLLPTQTAFDQNMGFGGLTLSAKISY